MYVCEKIRISSAPADAAKRGVILFIPLKPQIFFWAFIQMNAAHAKNHIKLRLQNGPGLLGFNVQQRKCYRDYIIGKDILKSNFV